MINYYLLTKPGIVLGNLITVGAGFCLASKGKFNFWLFLATLAGLAFIMASACVFNNYIDTPLDKKMERTKKRPLVTGKIKGTNAILFGSSLGVTGAAILFFYTNFLTLFIASMGFFVYVILYSLWKSKTVYGTAIGSIAGAVPPVVGYCSVSNQFDVGAIILFSMLVLWQMPHFFAIALNHLEDYKAAGIPVLPIQKGIIRTKVHMALYIFAFVIASSLLTLFHYSGIIYLTIALTMGIIWLAMSVNGFFRNDDQSWARQMFRASLLLIMTISILIPLDYII